MREKYPRLTRWTIRRLRAQRILDLHIRHEVILRELLGNVPYNCAEDVWRVLRMLHLWLNEPEAHRVELYDGASLDNVERAILLAAYDERIRDPLAIILSCLGSSEQDPQKLGWACLCAADWAALGGFKHTMLAFTYAAAFATESPHYYLVAELAAVNVELTELPSDDSENYVGILEARRRRLTAMVAARGGLVSLTRFSGSGN